MKKTALLILMAACFSVAANLADNITEPKQVSIDGKTFYSIQNASELAWFSVATKENYDLNAILENDISVESINAGDTTEWEPIGISREAAFEGIFDGNGKTIHGAYTKYSLRGPDTLVNGFFRYVGKNGVVKNLSLESCTIVTNHQGIEKITELKGDYEYPNVYSVVGGIVGENNGTLQNVAFDDGTVKPQGGSSTNINGNIYRVNYVAGNIAGVNRGSIENAISRGDIVFENSLYNPEYRGGIVGFNEGYITDVKNECSMTASLPVYLGGICALNYGTIENAEMHNRIVTTEGVAGGIVAENHGKIINAANYHSIKTNKQTYSVYFGGIAGSNNGEIVHSIFYGKDNDIYASVTGYSVGSYNVVSPVAKIGGIAGSQSGIGKIDNCGAYFALLEASSSYKYQEEMQVGGIVGMDSGSVTNSYAAFYRFFGAGTRSPLYNLASKTGTHDNNFYDAQYLYNKFENDTTGVSTEIAMSPELAWMLNTKNGSEKSSGIWTYKGSYPVFAEAGDKLPQRVICYSNGIAWDTLFTDANGHIVFTDKVPEPTETTAFRSWQFVQNGKNTDVDSSTVIVADTAIYASFEKKENLKYTITFVDFDNSILQTLNDVPYGTVPEYTGKELLRDTTKSYSYKFKKWEPAITEVIRDNVYRAIYDSTAIKYNVSIYNVFEDEGDTTLDRTVTATYNQKGVSCSFVQYRGHNKFTHESPACSSIVVVSDTAIYGYYVSTLSSSSAESSSSEIASSSSSSNEGSSSSVESSSSEIESSSSGILEESSSSENSSSSETVPVFAQRQNARRSVQVNGLNISVRNALKGVWILTDVQGNVIDRVNVDGNSFTLKARNKGIYILRSRNSSELLKVH